MGWKERTRVAASSSSSMSVRGQESPSSAAPPPGSLRQELGAPPTLPLAPQAEILPQRLGAIGRWGSCREPGYLSVQVSQDWKRVGGTLGFLLP